MQIFGNIARRAIFTRRENLITATTRVINYLNLDRGFYSQTEDAEMNKFTEYLDNLKNYEKVGVPKGAGTDSKDGFDLGRMRRLMELLGNPQSKFKVILCCTLLEASFAGQ